MMNDKKLDKQILLLDDDEVDYLLLKAMLLVAFGEDVKLDWYQKDGVAAEMICSAVNDN
jgi:hypothetical protein